MCNFQKSYSALPHTIFKLLVQLFPKSDLNVCDYIVPILIIIMLKLLYDATYVVKMGKLWASLEPSWAMKIAGYVEQLTRRSSKYIISCLSGCQTE